MTEPGVNFGDKRRSKPRYFTPEQEEAIGRAYWGLPAITAKELAAQWGPLSRHGSITASAIRMIAYRWRDQVQNAPPENENTPDPTGPGCLSISPKEEPNAYNQSNSSTVFLP